MNGLLPFSLPIKGLRDGVHAFKLDIDETFFAEFPESPIKQGKVLLDLQLDKRPNLMVLDFDFKGTVRTECDRCMAEIDLPIADQQQLLVKLSETEVSNDPEVIYIHPETSDLNVGPYAYEYVILAIPLIRAYDCQAEQNPPCNKEIFSILEKNAEKPDQVEESEPNTDNPLWSELKNWKNSN
jgi:uncharacterized protein